MMVGVLFALPLLTSCTASPSDLSATVATDPINFWCRTNHYDANVNATQLDDPSTIIAMVRFTFDLRNENGTTMGSNGTKVVDVLSASSMYLTSSKKRSFSAQIPNWSWKATAQYFVGTTVVRTANADCSTPAP